MTSNPERSDVSLEEEDTDSKTYFAVRIAPEHLFSVDYAEANNFPQLCSFSAHALSYIESSNIGLPSIDVVNPTCDPHFAMATHNLEVFTRAKHLEDKVISHVIQQERGCYGFGRLSPMLKQICHVHSPTMVGLVLTETRVLQIYNRSRVIKYICIGVNIAYCQ